MLRLPLTTEFAAARAAAAEAGLGAVTPRLLHLGNHTSVRLDPWPVVARIASGTSFDFVDGSIARELAIAAHLASRGAPAVRPTSMVCCGPYLDNSCAVTLWEFVEGRAVSGENDELEAARSLRRVHEALADVDIELPTFIDTIQSCDAILDDCAQAPKLAADDRRFLAELYARVRAKIDRIEAAQQPLHGDPHLGNVLVSSSTAIWIDLESACTGPLEWDVASLPRAAWSEFGGIDVDVAHFLADVRSLCVAIWCWAEFDRSEATAEAATYHLRRLRDRFR